jgi:hypothetical protein
MPSGTRGRRGARGRRELGVVGREAHQGREAEALLGGDPEAAMLADHPLVAAELLRVVVRAAEHLAPPGGHVTAMLLTETPPGNSGEINSSASTRS